MRIRGKGGVQLRQPVEMACKQPTEQHTSLGKPRVQKVCCSCCGTADRPGGPGTIEGRVALLLSLDP